jgi:hypothetical protein
MHKHDEACLNMLKIFNKKILRLWNFVGTIWGIEILKQCDISN